MKTLRSIILAAACSSFLATTSFADEFGTKEEAATLLERAIALVRIDKNRALNMFTTGDGGLIQKDLYVFCFTPDGTITAHPNAVGLDIYGTENTDLQGTQLGESLFKAARAGGVGEVTYKLPRYTTGSDEEFTKTALMTRVAGQVCGVGYYHPQ